MADAPPPDDAPPAPATTNGHAEPPADINMLDADSPQPSTLPPSLPAAPAGATTDSPATPRTSTPDLSTSIPAPAPTSTSTSAVGAGGAPALDGTHETPAPRPTPPPRGTPTAAATAAATTGTANNLPPSAIIPPAQAHGSPTRAWLNARVTPALLEGMKALAVQEPERPLAWLGEFLLRRSAELEGS